VYPDPTSDRTGLDPFAGWVLSTGKRRAVSTVSVPSQRWLLLPGPSIEPAPEAADQRMARQRQLEALSLTGASTTAPSPARAR
jgi:hypothetical protein